MNCKYLNTGAFGSAAFPSHLSMGVRGTYIGNGSFNGIGVDGLSLPSGVTIPNGRGCGIGGNFKGGTKVSSQRWLSILHLHI